MIKKNIIKNQKVMSIKKNAHITYLNVMLYLKKKCWQITSRNAAKVITERLSKKRKKKNHILEKKKTKQKPTEFKSCYIVMTFYFKDLDRNEVE